MKTYQFHGDPTAPNHASLPDCTGTVDVNGVVSNKPCQTGVRQNNGQIVPAFPMPGEPYSQI